MVSVHENELGLSLDELHEALHEVGTVFSVGSFTGMTMAIIDEMLSPQEEKYVKQKFTLLALIIKDNATANEPFIGKAGTVVRCDYSRSNLAHLKKIYKIEI